MRTTLQHIDIGWIWWLRKQTKNLSHSRWLIQISNWVSDYTITIFIELQLVQQTSLEQQPSDNSQHFIHLTLFTFSGRVTQLNTNTLDTLHQYLHRDMVDSLGRFPSMASFFLQQSAQRYGPSHGFDAGQKPSTQVTDRSLFGAWSIWQIAHLRCPEFSFKWIFPSLHSESVTMKLIFRVKYFQYLE